MSVWMKNVKPLHLTGCTGCNELVHPDKQISYSGETCEAAGFNEVVTKLAHTGLFDLEEIPGHGTALICR